MNRIVNPNVFNNAYTLLGTQPPQLDLFLLASTQIGVEEVPGIKNNPIIMDYFADIGHEWVQCDELAWCSAFVNWVAKNCGYIYTGKLNARSWLEIGSEVQYPLPGDIVVLYRNGKDSIYGHVGFYAGKTDSWIMVLGGNQSNKVCIKQYHIERLLSYRRLTLNTESDG